MKFLSNLLVPNLKVYPFKSRNNYQNRFINDGVMRSQTFTKNCRITATSFLLKSVKEISFIFLYMTLLVVQCYKNI